MRKFNGNKRYKAVDRYFRSRNLFRRWIFSDVVKTKDRNKKYVCINKMMDTKIQRHIKIRAVANLYLPKYKEYFENRQKLIKDISLIQWKFDKQRNVITEE
ncbi:reverse transcriptase [Legionella sainthelensi]|uniref:Reverse transcriptase n=1 Tax=Legionella sainthelensi TaxID=28087 RepID=A0A0W0YBS1_9GAMM|nr:reverse transcriptase [Legionella sainthelensi]VEH35581.1 reverse transcriptase [Legionella sainthelensi]